jgi:hypothetical protein
MVLMETRAGKTVLAFVVAVILIIPGLWIYFSWNKRNFNDAYDQIHKGQGRSEVEEILRKHQLSNSSDFSTTIETIAKIGIENDLIMRISFDESGKVIERYAVDTGFNMFFF